MCPKRALFFISITFELNHADIHKSTTFRRQTLDRQPTCKTRAHKPSYCQIPRLHRLSR